MDENKKQIVIMVVIVIILILTLLGILIYYVKTNEVNVNNSYNSSTTSSSTTKLTTTNKNEVKELEASNAVSEYLENLKSEEKISEYNILNINILDENDLCPNEVYDASKIYVNLNVSYNKIDNTFYMSPDEKSDGDVYESSINIVFIQKQDKYEVEKMYSGC